MARRSLAIRPAPRTLPTGLKIQALFGGYASQFGWLFFGFSMIFAGVFAGQSELTTMLRFIGDRGTTPGRVETVARSNHRENKKRIYEVTYSYEVDGRRFSGNAYAKDAWEGEAVTVEYMLRAPGVSRIVGMRSAPFGASSALIIVVPLMALGFIVSGLRTGARAIRLLEIGELSYGRLISKTETTMRFNKKPVYALTFEFEDAEKRSWKTVVKSLRTEQLEDEHEEPLLYDPIRPNHALLIDSLPRSPTIDSRGDFQATGTPAVALLLPAIALLANGAFLLAQL